MTLVPFAKTSAVEDASSIRRGGRFRAIFAGWTFKIFFLHDLHEEFINCSFFGIACTAISWAAQLYTLCPEAGSRPYWILSQGNQCHFQAIFATFSQTAQKFSASVFGSQFHSTMYPQLYALSFHIENQVPHFLLINSHFLPTFLLFIFPA
jgi:hypothetical protein